MCWQKQRAAHSQKGETPGSELERKFPTSCHSLDGKPRSAREKEGGRGGKKKQCSWKRTLASPMDNHYCHQLLKDAA